MTYVTSDWHGTHLSRIRQLLSLANFGPRDWLFVLGDVVDRGAHGISLLKWIMRQPNVQLILGNHELMMLDCDFVCQEVNRATLDAFGMRQVEALRIWKHNGALPTLEGLKQEMPEVRDRIFAYLRKAPYYRKLRVGEQTYLLVHGGLGEYRKNKALEDYSAEELLWTRPDFDTVYSKKFITVVGHTPTCFYGRQFKGKMIRTETWWNIDTGAACDLAPMLLRLEDGKAFYLPERSS